MFSPTYVHVFWLLHWDDIMFLFVWSMESMHVEFEIGLLYQEYGDVECEHIGATSARLLLYLD